MDFAPPLLKGALVNRYKRFLADVTLEDGAVVTAHCANSGAMTGVCAPRSEVWLTPADSPKRKLKFTWELIRVGGELVGINTGRANALAAEALDRGLIPELCGYDRWKREVKYGANSRIDLLLSGEGRPDCYVEVKTVSLMREGKAEFPDAVTKRGAKHLAELSAMVVKGKRAAMLYIVQRAASGLSGLDVAADIDPAYAAALRTSRAIGVEALCYTCEVTTKGMSITAPLPILAS